jgi:hypothetical protein
MPIGELFDLEGLAAHCKETRRKTFFLSSVPLKVSIEFQSVVLMLIIF